MNNKLILSQVKEILKTNQDSSYYKITAMSNISALLYDYMDNLNWLGFYLLENDNLVLGPFQGKIACSKIKVGKGVCGACAQTLKTINVKNVHEFEGHIACDSRSNSELVVPVIINNKFIYKSYPKINTFTVISSLGVISQEKVNVASP